MGLETEELAVKKTAAQLDREIAEYLGESPRRKPYWTRIPNVAGRAIEANASKLPARVPKLRGDTPKLARLRERSQAKATAPAVPEASGKSEATCAVCLRKIQLRGDRPIRHGFSAVGVRHGQSGGWHTGPCGGSNFPHLGISSEGTVWALGQAQKSLEKTDEGLRRYATNPDINWYPTKRGVPDIANGVVLHYGDPANYKTGASSYAHEHKQRVSELESRKRELDRAIETYEKTIANWKPESATAAAAKTEPVHLAEEVNGKFGAWTGIACRSTRRMNPYAREKLKKTTDPSKVTCKRCKAQIK